MSYIDALKAHQSLADALDEGTAHMVWALGLYLDVADLEALAAEALTDGPDDKKIDFIYIDRELNRIVLAQGYYTAKSRDSAPANKAADLNTAVAWLLAADVAEVPDRLRSLIEESRNAIANTEVDSVALVYVHNLPESINVQRELEAAAQNAIALLADYGSGFTVSAYELGVSQIEHLYATRQSHIEVSDDVPCPVERSIEENGPGWVAHLTTVSGDWLHQLYHAYGQKLFSANYRGFLGVTGRKRINSAIRVSAESKAEDFWVFNNGITLLTRKITPDTNGPGLNLSGISIINGAQTTGSIASVDTSKHSLKTVRIVCRIVECSDPEKIAEIVRYNNTQNAITSWDQYSNDPEQLRLEREFSELGHQYVRRRGFRSPDQTSGIGIEDVVQPLLAFQGRHLEARMGKNKLFERKHLYKMAFEGKKARHVLFVYALARAIDMRRLDLKARAEDEIILPIEEQQLRLLRNLNFKQFFIAVVSHVLDNVVGQRIDRRTVGFRVDAARRDANSVADLVGLWQPVVEAALSLIGTQLDTATLGDRVAQENALEDVAQNVGAMIYAARSNLNLDAFAAVVAPA